MADGVNWTGTDDEDRYVGTSNDDTLDGDRGDDGHRHGSGHLSGMDRDPVHHRADLCRGHRDGPCRAVEIGL